MKIFKKLLLFFLVLCAVVPLVMSAGAVPTDATVQSYEERIADTQNKIAQAQAELQNIRNEQAYTWQEMAKLDELIAYNDELKRLAQSQLDAITLQIEETKNFIGDKEDEIDSQDSSFKSRMLATYMQEDIDYIEMIIGSESIVDFLTRVERAASIVEYDKNIMKNLKTSKQELEAAELKLEEAEAALLDQVSDYEAVIHQNTDIYNQKLDHIAVLQSNEALAKQNYEYYNKLDQELNAELENYLAELQRKNQSAYVGGSGGWPLQSGAYYYVSSEFGWRNLWGTQDYHLGIDLATPAGTHIYAFNAGKVIVSTFHWSYGNYVLIDHGGGIATLYAHMSENTVKVGDYVQAGQLVGYCGLTGNTSGYHLHFEVRENGTVVNPRNYLQFP